MCFSAQASFTAAALLLPAGAVGVYKAYRNHRRYVAICALPFLFGLQQLFEGLVWTSGEAGDMFAIGRYSLAYMFFSWFAWTVWIPISAFFLEPNPRKPLYLGFAVMGAILGAGLYVPCFVHQGWLTVTSLPHAFSYGEIGTFDFLVSRYFTYVIYVSAVVLPLLIASKREVKISGMLVALVLAANMALMSLYLIGMIFWKEIIQQTMLANRKCWCEDQLAVKGEPPAMKRTAPLTSNRVRNSPASAYGTQQPQKVPSPE